MELKKKTNLSGGLTMNTALTSFVVTLWTKYKYEKINSRNIKIMQRSYALLHSISSEGDLSTYKVSC